MLQLFRKIQLFDSLCNASLTFYLQLFVHCDGTKDGTIFDNTRISKFHEMILLGFLAMAHSTCLMFKKTRSKPFLLFCSRTSQPHKRTESVYGDHKKRRKHYSTLKKRPHATHHFPCSQQRCRMKVFFLSTCQK
jgi:hypothetical protein